MGTLASLALACAVGLFIGLMAGLLGIGGGAFMIPLFRLVFGLSPVASTASSLFAILPISFFGGISRIRGKTALPALGLCLGLGGALTSPIGVQLAQIAPPWLVMVVAGLAIGWASTKMFRRAFKEPKAGTKHEADASEAAGADCAAVTSDAAGAAAGDSAARSAGDAGTSEAAVVSKAADASEAAGVGAGKEEAAWRLTPKRALAAVAIGASAGVIAGFAGIGGGFLMTPLMISVLGVDVKRAAGTSLIAISMLALPGAFTQFMLGNVAVSLSLIVAISSIPASNWGARMAKTFDDRKLCFLLGVVSLLAAVLLIANEFVGIR